MTVSYSNRFFGFLNSVGVVTFTIASGASLSEAISLKGYVPTAIQMPAAWDAADLTFQGSVDGVAYNNIYDQDENELTVQAAASRLIMLEPSKFFAGVELKIRSGTAALAVNQSDTRTLKLMVRKG